MGRRPTTGEQGRNFSFRLNPAFPEDADAIRAVDEAVAQGFSIRQIMTDAILRAIGRTPEMYSQPQATQSVTVESMEALLMRFLDEYNQHAPRMARPLSARDEDDHDISDAPMSAWTRNFAKGFAARQAQALGDEDDDL